MHSISAVSSVLAKTGTLWGGSDELVYCKSAGPVALCPSHLEIKQSFSTPSTVACSSSCPRCLAHPFFIVTVTCSLYSVLISM